MRKSKNNRNEDPIHTRMSPVLMLTLPTAATLKNKVGTLEEKGGKRGVEWKLGGQPQGASTCIQPELEGKVMR